MNKIQNLKDSLFCDKGTRQIKLCIEKLNTMNNNSEDDELKVVNVIKSKHLFNNELFHVCTDNHYVQNTEIYQDTEFFTTLSEKATSVFSNIHNCSTYGGKFFSEQVYKNPTCNIDLLNKRTHYLTCIEQKYQKNQKQTDNLLKTIKDNEKHITWLLEEKDETLRDLYSMVFFRLKGLQPLNNIGSALTSYNIYRIIVSPLFGIVAPIIYFLIPYVIVLYKFKVYIPFTTYIKTMVYSVFSASDTLFGTNKFFKYARIISYVFSAVFYFQGIFTSIDISKTVNKMCGLIISNFNSVIDYLDASKKLIDMYWNSNDSSSYIKNSYDIKEEDNENRLIDSLKAVKKDYNIFHNFGIQLKAYKYLDIDTLLKIVRKSYVLDTLIGAIKFKLSRNFCICNYIDNGSPVLQFDGIIHPSLGCDKAVENDVRFGVVDNEQNAIITSPNSSGKSILIKSIIVNVMMSQTMGICCCKSSIVTPFTYITTQINVPDSTGHESLFEAEMYRCKNTLDKLKCLHENNDRNGYSLVVMDEIFNSTNPIEAVAGAYAVCKKITSFKSNILIFTTHLGYLTKLAKDVSCKFVNYRMETKFDDKEQDIMFTYKFERGVNKHLLALELLKKTGFDSDIIDEAIEIKNRLTFKK